MLSEEDVWVHQRGRSSLQLPVSRVQNVGEDRVMLLWVRQSERTEDIRPRDQHNVPQSQWRRHGRQCGGGSYQAEPWWGRQPEVLPEVLSAHLPGEVVTVWLTQVLHSAPRRSVLRQTGGGQNTPGQGGQRQRGRLQEHDASEAGHQVRKHELSYSQFSVSLFVFRYGQDDIEKMLLDKGAVETVEVPKKVSIVDVDPPWVRRVSRREPAAWGWESVSWIWMSEVCSVSCRESLQLFYWHKSQILYCGKNRFYK